MTLWHSSVFCPFLIVFFSFHFEEINKNKNKSNQILKTSQHFKHPRIFKNYPLLSLSLLLSLCLSVTNSLLCTRETSLQDTDDHGSSKYLLYFNRFFVFTWLLTPFNSFFQSLKTCQWNYTRKVMIATTDKNTNFFFFYSFRLR